MYIYTECLYSSEACLLPNTLLFFASGWLIVLYVNIDIVHIGLCMVLSFKSWLGILTFSILVVL